MAALTDKMDRSEAVKVISESLSKGTSSPFVGFPDRDEAVREAGEALLSDVLEPFKVAVTAASFPEYDFVEFSGSEVYAIAGDCKHTLLFSPTLGKFALGWGENPEAMTMLGFASDDALAEWRG